MAVRSRRPWMSVGVGLILGFTAASWLIAPKVAEMSEKKRRSNICSYYSPARDGDPRHGKGWLPGTSPPAAAGAGLQEERKNKESPGGNSSSHNGSGDWGPPEDSPRNFLYVGVMTAKKYLDTRAVAAYRTWAPYIPGKVEFFSSQGSEDIPLPEAVPVISLPGVDDSYPPQKKSFMMIKHMHDHYLDKYEWFMRADDDVYIKGKYSTILLLLLLLLLLCHLCAHHHTPPTVPPVPWQEGPPPSYSSYSVMAGVPTTILLLLLCHGRSAHHHPLLLVPGEDGARQPIGGHK